MSGNMNNMDKYSRFYRNHMTSPHAEALKDIAEQANGTSDAVLQAAEAIANEFLMEQQQMENQEVEVPEEVSALSNSSLDKAIKEAMENSDATVGVIGEDSLMAQYVEAVKAKEAEAADEEATETVVEETVSEEPVEEKSEEVKEETTESEETEGVSLEEALPEVYTLPKAVYHAYATAKAVGGRLFSSLTAPSYDDVQKKWSLFCLFAEHAGKIDTLTKLSDLQKVKVLDSIMSADKFDKKNPMTIYSASTDKFNVIEYRDDVKGLSECVTLTLDVDDVYHYTYRNFGAGDTSHRSQVLRIIADQL